MISETSNEEIQQWINQSTSIKEYEKKKFGEVFTPAALISEMLDKLPNKIWTKPNYLWLDPTAGIGNFLAIIYLRLMQSLEKWQPNKQKRSQHIIKNMLYMVELNPKNCRKCRQLFGKDANIICANFLSINYSTHRRRLFCKLPTEFNIIVGNPPFQDDKTNKQGINGSGGKNKLYERIFLKSYSMLSPNGYLAFITPDNIFSGNGIESYQLFLNKDMSAKRTQTISSAEGGINRDCRRQHNSRSDETSHCKGICSEAMKLPNVGGVMGEVSPTARGFAAHTEGACSVNNKILFVSFSAHLQDYFPSIQVNFCYFILHKNGNSDKSTTKIENSQGKQFAVKLQNRPVNPVRNWTPQIEKLIAQFFASNTRNNAVYNRGRRLSEYKGSKYPIVFTPSKTLHTNKQTDAVGYGQPKAILFLMSPNLEFVMDYSGKLGIGPNTIMFPFTTSAQGKKLEKFFGSALYKTMAEATRTNRQYLKLRFLQYLDLNSILGSKSLKTRKKRAAIRKNVYVRKANTNYTFRRRRHETRSDETSHCKGICSTHRRRLFCKNKTKRVDLNKL